MAISSVQAKSELLAAAAHLNQSQSLHDQAAACESIGIIGAVAAQPEVLKSRRHAHALSLIKSLLIANAETFEAICDVIACPLAMIIYADLAPFRLGAPRPEHACYPLAR